MTGKIDKRIIKTKQLIKTTFLDLLTQYDYDKITITLLARTAQIDRKTFYMHYSNTKELLEEYGQDLLNNAMKKIDDSSEFTVQLLFKTFNNIFRENEPLFETVINTQINVFLIDLIKLRIITLLEQKLLDPDMPIPPNANYHLSYITTGLISIYIEWIKSNDCIDIDELSDIAMDIVSFNIKQLQTISSS